VAATERSRHFLFIGLEQPLSSGMSREIRIDARRRVTPPWQWLLLLGGFALIFWSFVPKRVGPNPAPAPASPSWWLLLVFALVIWVLAFAFQFFRTFDPGVRRANKRALEGDLDGAIQDLREQIEDKSPTQVRANALGLLLMKREQWADAAGWFRKAEEIGGFKGVCQANLGLALLKGGKPEEALPVFQEALRTGPQTPVMTCLVGQHSCLALAALGRWDEAHEQLQVAEEVAGRLSKAQRAALEKAFDECRQKLGQQPQP
jgi:tetratricopeptide (TPR) repeat protein